uniref:DH domain-containing protein n=1 Tax=Glossina austeni TaxID=7395 RepID=A0A1A9UGY0_GLOAU
MGDESPQPFRRERNLSNRNFAKRNSIRHQFANGNLSSSNNSFDRRKLIKSNKCETEEINSIINHKSAKNMAANSIEIDDDDDDDKRIDVERSASEGETTDPALLGVRQKVLRFENFQTDECKQIKNYKTNLISDRVNRIKICDNSDDNQCILPTMGAELSKQLFALQDGSREKSPDAVDGDNVASNEKTRKRKESKFYYKCEQIVAGASKEVAKEFDDIQDRSLPVDLNSYVSAVNISLLTPPLKHSISHSAEQLLDETATEKNQDFVSHDEEEEEESIELRDKGFKSVQPILDELIKTEETYVENLWLGINNYGNVFKRKDLPIGLRGKKYVLLGNVEHLAEFHRDEFLPMLKRNRHDLKRIFEEFIEFIEQNCFYGYVLFTINKKRSLKLCDTYKNYFKMIQTELDDKLGINSFLVQPIQRMARYPLLLQQFITTLFKNCDYGMKPVIESCCRLEKKFRNLLITTNESEIINDIVCLNESTEFNTFYQGKFRKVSEFQVYDHSLKRSYRSKVFIFDKCIVYTEIKGKQLIFHGRYPCEHIGIIAKTKSFTLYYDQRKQQECDFIADPMLIETWLELIREMITSYAEEERRKLKELHSHDHGEHIYRKPANLSLFRDSNRFSSDSGIGNIWAMPKPENEEAINNRTTWYAVT